MDIKELTGLTSSHIKEWRSPTLTARPEAAAAFFKMREAAAKEGIELFAASSFRSFESQLTIWNEKCSGKRPVYDSQGKAMETSTMSSRDLTLAVLGWSALPGTSRHHWGTDFDLIDMKAISPGYQVQLSSEETEEGGVFHKLRVWLDNNLERFGFFRPYARFQNGVFPEPWHVSFRPLADQALKSLIPEIIEKTIKENPVREKETILASLPEIYENYILNISD